MNKDQEIQNILADVVGQVVTDRLLNQVCDRLVKLGGTDVSVSAHDGDVFANLTIAGMRYEATLSGSTRTVEKPAEKVVEKPVEKAVEVNATESKASVETPEGGDDEVSA